MSTATTKSYELVDFASIPPVACPCGQARRGLAEVDDYPGTIHVTEISVDARLHYHKRLTETYYILECDANSRMQLNDEILKIQPGTCIMIRPGTRHRALGKMKVLIVVYPKLASCARQNESADRRLSEVRSGRRVVRLIR
jgi:mannose-6-phosphate isomerase-like protein (cupin superfamily)